MQGARRRLWWLLGASRATPQTPLSLPTLRDRADFPSSIVVASLLGHYPTASAPPRLRGNLPRSRPRRRLRQAPGTVNYPRRNPGKGPALLATLAQGCAAAIWDARPCRPRGTMRDGASTPNRP